MNSTTYREHQTGGKGGDGGNTENTGGKGAYQLRDGVSSSNIYAVYGGHGRMPGGGGGGGLIWGGSIKNGAQGMVIIHYMPVENIIRCKAISNYTCFYTNVKKDCNCKVPGHL